MTTEVIVAALRACKTQEEVEEIFNLEYKSMKTPALPVPVAHKCNYLMLAMGDCKYFDLPSDDETRYNALLAIFLQGAWKAPFEMQLVKELVSKYL